MLNAALRPCTAAIFAFDYRVVLAAVDAGLARSIWKARLGHPVAGRLPGSREHERELVIQALIRLAEFANPSIAIGTGSKIFNYLDSVAVTASKHLGPPWPRVIAREATLQRYVSRGKSQRAAAKIVKIFALIHAGFVTNLIERGERYLDEFESAPSGPADENLIQLMCDCPAIRIDQIIDPFEK